jgi:hypothetical protein
MEQIHRQIIISNTTCFSSKPISLSSGMWCHVIIKVQEKPAASIFTLIPRREAVGSSDTLMFTYQTIRHHSQEDSNVNSENLKFQIVTLASAVKNIKAT